VQSSGQFKSYFVGLKFLKTSNTMFKPAYFLLMVCAIVPFVVAIPPPKCEAGFGLVDPNEFPYGQAKPGDCKKCAVAGCQFW